MKISNLIKFSTVLVSLCFIISCGSTSVVPKDSIESDEGSQQTALNSTVQESNAQDNNAVEESQPATEPENSEEESPELQELVDESTILKNPVNEDEELEFSEPVVFDAPPQEEPLEDKLTVQITEPRYSDYENQNKALSAEDSDAQEPVETAPAVTETPSSAKTEVVANKPSDSTPAELESVNTNASNGTGSSAKQNEQSQSADQNTNSITDATPALETKTEQETDVFKNPAVIIPSRSMTVKNKQYIEVTYPGSGWVYLGETAKEPIFRYFGRKLGNSDTKFTLRSTKAGKTYLHFYKNDVLTSTYIDDYLEVEVENQDAKSNEKATAPSYAEVVPPKPVRTVTQISPEQNSKPQTKSAEPEVQNKKEAKATTQTKPAVQQEKKTATENTDDKNVKTVIQDTSNPKDAAQTESTPASSPVQKTTVDAPKTNKAPAEETETSAPSANSTIKIDRSKNLLEEAKKSLNEKKYELALAQIQAYLDSSSVKIDEALYVQGQILEADSPVKNVKNALDSYDTLIKRYPASKFWSKANKRRIFIKRFYIDIY